MMNKTIWRPASKMFSRKYNQSTINDDISLKNELKLEPSMNCTTLKTTIKDMNYCFVDQPHGNYRLNVHPSKDKILKTQKKYKKSKNLKKITKHKIQKNDKTTKITQKKFIKSKNNKKTIKFTKMKRDSGVRHSNKPAGCPWLSILIILLAVQPSEKPQCKIKRVLGEFTSFADRDSSRTVEGTVTVVHHPKRLVPSWSYEMEDWTLDTALPPSWLEDLVHLSK